LTREKRVSTLIGVEPAESECVCTNLRMASRSVVRLYDRALAEVGLRSAAYSILSRVDADGPMTITDLAARLALERTSCSREVDALVRTGLLSTEIGTDRRQRLVGLSAEGSRRLAAGRTHWRVVQQRLAGAFGVSDTADLLVRLRALHHESERLAILRNLGAAVEMDAIAG
jgi:DNA-binding MarR family transcriptional regulator